MEDKRIKLEREEKREKYWERFVESFDGIRKLTSDGCMKRYEITRDEQYKNNKENRTASLEFKRREDWMEDKIQSALIYLMRKGYRPTEFMSIEEFVVENRDQFGGDWMEFIDRLSEEV